MWNYTDDFAILIENRAAGHALRELRANLDQLNGGFCRAGREIAVSFVERIARGPGRITVSGNCGRLRDRTRGWFDLEILGFGYARVIQIAASRCSSRFRTFTVNFFACFAGCRISTASTATTQRAAVTKPTSLRKNAVP